MALDLSTINFAVNTKPLEEASARIGELVTNVGKLDKAAQDAARTEATLARAAKDNAKANLDNAKAQDVRLKSTITADKADTEAEKALTKKNKAIKEQNDSLSASEKLLQKTRDAVSYMTEGLSRGQATQTAYLKSIGGTNDEIKEFIDLKQLERKLIGKDTFDDSQQGLLKLKNAYGELKESIRQYTAESGLSSRQTRELARDKERIIESMKAQGASFSEIRKAVRAHNDEYIKLAGTYNGLMSAEEAVIKNRKEVVAATNYVTKADQQMLAALNQSNAAIDKAGTDSLVRYENALRKSGVSQEVATQKLAKYRVQLEQVQKQELARREQHLTRALAPQATDVVVSLWSGQNPLTVLLQQGGQVTDLFMQSGIAAEKFGEVVKKSMASMLPSILTVVKGVGGLLVDGFMAAGNAITRFIGDVTLFNAANNQVYKFLVSDGPSVAASHWGKLSDILSKSVAVGFAAVLATLVAMAIEYKNIIRVEGELSKALATSGGAMGFSKDQAVAYAESMKGIGVGTLKAVEAITEFTKVGKIGKDGLDLIIKSAIELEKYAGVAITETAKKFSELQDEPTKALVKFAESNGYVSASILDTVASLEQQGDKTKAATAATEAMRVANLAMAEEAKVNLSPLEILWLDIKSAVGKVKQEIYELTTSDAAIGAMKTAWQTFAVAVAEVWFVLKGVGRTLGGLFAMMAAGSPTQAASIWKEMGDDSERLRKEQDKLIDSIMGVGEVSKKNFSEDKERNSQYAAWRKENEKALERQYSKEERLGLKKKQLQNDLNAGIIDEIKYKQALAGWERIIMGEKKPKPDKQTQKDLETEIDILNKRVGLTSSYNNELDSLQRLRAKGLITEQEYIHDVEELIKLQPFYVEQQKQINAAHDLSNKLIGKADMLGKDYYKTLEQIQKFQDAGLYSPEKAEQLRQAAFDQTELAKSYLNYVKESASTYIKYREETQKSLDNSTLENQKLDDRVALLGLTTEEQKQLKIQQQQRNALLSVDLKLTTQIAKIRESLRQGKIEPASADKAIIEAEQAAAEERKLINKEVAVQYAEDFMAEMQKIKSGITDSIVTALFEGGKAGGKKLREVLVGILRQKVTLVVDAVVNTLLGSVVGSIFGGGSGGGTGGGAGGIANMISTGYSALTGGLTNSISTAFTNFATSSVGQSLGLSSMAADGMGPPAMTSMGSSLGTAAGMVGQGLAGYGISRAISGGYTTGGNTVNIIAGIASAFLGPIAGVIGGLINRAFGRKLTDTGIQGTFGGEEGFKGEAYKFYKGGWLRSDKTTTSELDAGITKMLSTAFKTMQVQVGTFATVLGLNADKLKDFTTSVKVSLHGLEGTAIDQAIQEALATANNELAQQVIGTWEKTESKVKKTVRNTSEDILAGADIYKEVEETITSSTYKASEYAKEGEKAIDTLTRLATSLSTVNSIFDTLGYTMYESSLKGGDMASKLAELFGGLDKLVSATSAYYQEFYSEEERQVTVLRQLTEAFSKQSLIIPKTREEYRKLVEAQDLTTEEGRKMYAWLIQMAPAFASITESLGASFDKIDEAYGTLESVIQRQISLLEKQKAVLEDSISKLRSIFDLLGRNIQELYRQVTPTFKMQASQGRQVISSAAATGVIPDIDLLSDSISAVRSEIESTSYTNQFEADKARLQLAGELVTIQGVVGEQLSIEEMMLKTLKDQVDSLNATLDAAKLQIDILKGIDNSVISVSEALDRLHKAMFPETAPSGEAAPKPPEFSSGPSGPAGGSTATVPSQDEQIRNLINQIGIEDLRSVASTAWLMGWTQDEIANAYGYSTEDVAAVFAAQGIPAFAKGGFHTGGPALVGENGPELINTGPARIWNASQTSNMLNSGGDLVSAVNELAVRLDNISYEVRAVAAHTNKTYKLLDRAAQNEDGSISVTAA